jgi:beta-phosphoglucomutase-like phosphatase (HAD superfamily)
VVRFEGAIFDVDGVLVDSPHEKAWRESLRELMDDKWRDIRESTTWSPEAFTRLVYETQVSGKPRMSGARAVLEYFDVPDDDDESRLAEYADRKQAKVVQLIEDGDFTVYPDALRFIIWAKDAGMRVAAASSSKNVSMLLHKIRLDHFVREQGLSSPSVRPGMTLLNFFDIDVSGRDFVRGKPSPEMFLAAADGLGVTPAAALVLEDAAAGIEAAKAGGMTVIGIARAGDAALLDEAGADIVVASLDEIDRRALAAGRLKKVQVS